MIDALVSWQGLLITLLVSFGVAPGLILRLLILVYPKDDPRRREWISDLYGIRFIERPLIVAEHVETIIREGIPHRFRSIVRRFNKRDKTLRESDYWHGLPRTTRFAIRISAWLIPVEVRADFIEEQASYIFDLMESEATLRHRLTIEMSCILHAPRYWIAFRSRDK